MKLPQFVITFALICKKILVIEFCCSYYTTSVIYGEGMSHTESRDSLIMWSRDMQKKALSLPPLKMAPGNVVNLEKSSEISPIKDEFLASSLKQNFW